MKHLSSKKPAELVVKSHCFLSQHISHLLNPVWKVFLFNFLRECPWINYFAHFLGNLSPKGSTKHFSVPDSIVSWAMKPVLGDEVGSRYTIPGFLCAGGASRSSGLHVFCIPELSTLSATSGQSLFQQHIVPGFQVGHVQFGSSVC